MSVRSKMLGAAALCLCAQHAIAGPLVVGSGNEAVIEPPVPHPNETPCVVSLLSKASFNATNAPFSFTPPAGCPGPWARVVLTMSLSVQKGVQFDRTGMLFMGGVPLWYGTTAEPRATLAPSWTFERDVTDYTALFEAAQTGYAFVNNYNSAVYPSLVFLSATLSFYPATATAPAPVTADLVLPLPTGGGTATLNTGTDQAVLTGTLPTNILRATLDLYLQAQIGDEFWYLCAPSAVAAELETCGNTSFREGEISVDGTPAGVAPIFPWIFTGGIDPYLWQPIPGVQTFNFTPFHADLSPFAGPLSNGATHTVAASVYNANGYFLATGALRLFLDHNATSVTGAVTRNTLRPANPNVAQNITTTNGASVGNVNITSTHDFTISGTVTGSAGTTTNTLMQTTAFVSDQRFNVSATKEIQRTRQTTTTVITSTASGPSGTTKITEQLTYPLSIDYSVVPALKGYFAQTTTADQQFLDTLLQEADGLPSAQTATTNAIQSTDTLFFNSGFQITGNNGQASTAVFARTGTAAPCFKRTLGATRNVLSEVQTGC